MAVGTIVQTKSANANAVTVTVTLDATATSGNLLVLGFGAASSRSLDTPPSGTTEIEGTGDFRASQGYLHYKISDGTETGFSATFNSSDGLSMVVLEIEWGQGTPTITSNENESGLTTASKPYTTGSVTPDNAVNVMVAYAHNGYVETYGPTIDNSFTIQESISGYSAGALATKVDQSGAVNPSWDTETTNYAALAAFSYGGKVYINDATTKDGGEVLQTYPGTWTDTSLTMNAVPDTTGLTGQLYVLVETASGALAYRAVTVGGTLPPGTHGISRGINPHRAVRLGGVLET